MMAEALGHIEESEPIQEYIHIRLLAIEGDDLEIEVVRGLLPVWSD